MLQQQTLSVVRCSCRLLQQQTLSVVRCSQHDLLCVLRLFLALALHSSSRLDYCSLLVSLVAAADLSAVRCSQLGLLCVLRLFLALASHSNGFCCVPWWQFPQCRLLQMQFCRFKLLLSLVAATDFVCGTLLTAWIAVCLATVPGTGPSLQRQTLSVVRCSCRLLQLRTCLLSAALSMTCCVSCDSSWHWPLAAMVSLLCSPHVH